MASKSYLLDNKIHDYILASSLREPDILRRLREETAALPNAIMQIPPEQGQLFALLMGVLNARKTLDIGVFTGYSSLAVALALPDDGRVVACDNNARYTAVAQRYWDEAGVRRKIDFQFGPAEDTLDQLLRAGEERSFDFAFIDADKTEYAHFYELCLSLVRRGGLIALDNMLQHGRVLDPTDRDAATQAIRSMNRAIATDTRVLPVMLPVADGLTLALVR
jgi:predicted O-methyltransferase YrrM